ncbi:MAG: oligopeptide ABC transporter substrate-binding protein OppA [Simkaniaceae bacterium]
MKTLLQNALILACLCVVNFGCHRPRATKNGESSSKVSETTLKINICSEPQTLDPRKVRSLSDVNIAKMFMEGLTRIGKNGKAEPALAEHIQVSEDLKTYTIKLKNAQWSNGDPITAHDFIYSWKTTLSPEFLSDYAFQLYVIKNGEAIKKGKLPASLLGASALDDKTLQVQLQHPTPYFEDLLAFPTFFPIHAQNDKENSNWALHPDTFISNGPFCMTEWKHQNYIKAEKNKNYWDSAEVHLPGIEMVMVDEEIGFRMFENNELHWEGSPFSVIPISAISNLKQKKQLQTHPMLGTYWIRTNTSDFPLNSGKLRKALAMAIDRNAIIEHITQGNQIPATGIVPQTMGLQEEPYFKTDPEQAAKLFYEALEENQMSPHQVSHLSLLYKADDRNHLIAQAVQHQWQENLGVHVRLEAVESKILFDRLSKGDFQMAIGSWIADFNDPVNFLEVFKSKSNGTNNTNWENPHYMETLEQSYVAKEPLKRQALLKSCEEILMDAMPVIPIFHYTMLYVKEERLKGVVLTPMGNIDFKWAYLDRK